MKITKRQLKQLIKEQIEEAQNFNVGDKVKMKPDIAAGILKMFGKGEETAYVNYAGVVGRVFKFGIQVKWANGTTNVNPSHALIKE